MFSIHVHNGATGQKHTVKALTSNLPSLPIFFSFFLSFFHSLSLSSPKMPLHHPNSHSLKTPTLKLTFTFTFILTLFSSSVTSHYNPRSSSSSSSSPLVSEWQSARATYYAASDPRDIVGGACGFGNLDKAGYGKATVALSSSLFAKGQICGACFELRCVNDLRNCIPATSILVTATNFCPPNYGFSADAGGRCNPPNKHFVLPIEAFEKIALWKAGNMPIQFRRIRCRKEGGIRFSIDGTGVFISVLVTNVGGAGDIVAVKIKGSQTGWLPMSRNWGQNWILNADMKKQPLSFEVTTSDKVILTSYNVAPKNWKIGQTFEGKQFD